MASKLNDNSEAMKRQQAEEAMALIEEADKLESEEEFAKAAYTYQKAAERLQRSGYASDHLEEIYTKITVLNNRISLAKKTGRLEERQHTAELQQQAFAIMDEANKLKAGGKYQDAIVQYTSAAGMLTEAGWSPAQLEGIQSEVTKLQQLMATASRPKVTAPAQYISQPETEQAPSEVPELQEIQTKRAETLQSFEDRRKADEEVQQAAFWAIDEGKAHVAKKNYEAAITAYQYAIEQLNSIGWTDQTRLLLQEVQNLTHLREMPEQAPAQGAREPSPAVATFQMLQGTEVSAESTAAASVQAVARFEERRQQAQEQINQAFALIDEADGHVQQEEWDLAINNYNSAIDLFNKSGWQGQTSNLYAVVARLREEKAKTEQAAALASVPAGAEEISSADSYVSAGFEAQSADLAAQLEAGFAARRENVQQFEARKQLERDTQEKAFAIIQEAQDLVSQNQFSDAADKYIEAISMLNSIGWQQQTAQLQAILEQLLDRQQQYEMAEQQSIQEQMVRAQEMATMQAQIQSQVAAEQEAMEERRVSARELEEYRQKVNEVKTAAFALIDEGERARSSRQPDFETAIAKYEEARDLLASINWGDQAERLRDVIATMTQEQEAWEAKAASAIRRQEEEAARQAALGEEIRQRMEEDARLKEFQQKRLQEYVQKRTESQDIENQAMDLLGEAKKFRTRHKFEEATEFYKKAAELFQSIGWNQQLIYIQKEILDTQGDAQDWEQELEAKQRLEEARQQRAKEFEEKARQEDEDKKAMIGDIKSMIKKAAVQQERKQIREKIQKDDDYKKYLAKEQADKEKAQGLRSLKEELRKQLAEEEVKTREEQEQEEQEKGKVETDSIKRMIRKASKQTDDE